MPQRSDRSVVLFMFLSLDGVAEEPSDWFFDTGPEIFELLGRVVATQDDVLLGHGTYDYWVDHWPASDLEPFASFINATPKHVVASTELRGHWEHTVRVTGSLDAYVRELQRRPGRDIGVHGSIRLARSLLAAELVDELRLVVPPVIAGRGERLFDAGSEAGLQAFDLVDVERTPNGTLYLHYRRSPAT